MRLPNLSLARRVGIVALALAGCVLPAKMGNSASATYTYDPVGRVATALYDNGLCVAYTYDANGNRTSINSASTGAPVTATWGSGVWGCINWTP